MVTRLTGRKFGSVVCWQRPRRGELRQQRLRRLASEHTEPQHAAIHCCFEIRNGGQRGGQLRLRARAVELRAATCIQASGRDAHRFALVVGVASRDGQLLLRAAQFEVVARNFGGHAHLRGVHIGFCRL
jgi:hypothetical protein